MNTPSADTIHYGPVWNKPGHKHGDSYALCDAKEPGGACLMTHLPSITCPDCKAALSAAGESSNA